MTQFKSFITFHFVSFVIQNQKWNTFQQWMHSREQLTRNELHWDCSFFLYVGIKNLALTVDQFKQQSTKDFHTKLLGYGFSNQIICNETDESRNILKLLTLEYIARQKDILFWKRHQIAFHSCQIKDCSLLLQAPNYSNLISNELTAHIMCSPHKYFILHDPNKYIYLYKIRMFMFSLQYHFRMITYLFIII